MVSGSILCEADDLTAYDAISKSDVQVICVFGFNQNFLFFVWRRGFWSVK
jgi:hypothetical protein